MTYPRTPTTNILSNKKHRLAYFFEDSSKKPACSQGRREGTYEVPTDSLFGYHSC
jgi:hypothetical protein